MNRAHCRLDAYLIRYQRCANASRHVYRTAMASVPSWQTSASPDPQDKWRVAVSVYAVNFSLPLGFCILICILNGYWFAAFSAPVAIAVVSMLAPRLFSHDAAVQHTGDSLTAQRALSQRIDGGTWRI